MRGGTTFRTLLPLLLVGMCLLAWFEPWIPPLKALGERFGDRKSTRLNSSH